LQFGAQQRVLKKCSTQDFLPRIFHGFEDSIESVAPGGELSRNTMSIEGSAGLKAL
jgi:hypothetical protein